MAWGGSSASSSIPLNYARIVRALGEKKSKGRGYTDKVIVHAPNVHVHRKGDNVYLHLHNTDIVEFRPNGTKALFSGGWATNQLTRHWWWQAAPGLNIVSATPNQYSDKQLFAFNRGMNSPNYSLFYDGMVVDMHGHRISEVKYGVKCLPNAEAKALRKDWLEVMNEEYMPHVEMLVASDHQPYAMYNREAAARAIALFQKGGFDYGVMLTAMATHRKTSRASMDKYVHGLWHHYVTLHNMLDEQPYLPK